MTTKLLRQRDSWTAFGIGWHQNGACEKFGWRWGCYGAPSHAAAVSAKAAVSDSSRAAAAGFAGWPLDGTVGTAQNP